MQRQVAGRLWHNQRQQGIFSLESVICPERCIFSFGRTKVLKPGALYVSCRLGVCVRRSGYQCSGFKCACFVFSRPAFTKFQICLMVRCSTKHCRLSQSVTMRSSCKLDSEWPSSEFIWAPHVSEDGKSDDLWAPDAVAVEPVALQHPPTTARSPPHAVSNSIHGHSAMVAELEVDAESMQFSSLCSRSITSM